jgi:monoamine oxidase
MRTAPQGHRSGLAGRQHQARPAHGGDQDEQRRDAGGHLRYRGAEDDDGDSRPRRARVPLRRPRTLDYKSAGFDPLKQRAIRELGLGKNDKLHLQFSTRQPWTNPGPWPGKTNGTTWSDQGYQAAWEVSVAQPGIRGIQAGYPSGSYAGSFTPAKPYSTIETEPKLGGYANEFLAQIEPVLPGLTAAWNGKASLSVPHLDPNYSCSYSYYRVGQYHSFCGYEAVRQGNIHFAGEHCTEAFQGYMEGGAITGVAAANEILADLKRL